MASASSDSSDGIQRAVLRLSDIEVNTNVIKIRIIWFI